MGEISYSPQREPIEPVTIKKFFLIAGAILLVGLGCFTMISPIPGGSLVMPAGVAILICESSLVRRYIQLSRRRMPRLNRVMCWFENRVGKRIGDVLKKTQPIKNPNELYESADVHPS